VRNSSLVKWSCADNVAGLKRTAEAVAIPYDIRPCDLRVAFGLCVVRGVVVVLGRGASCIR
jgi:hypothetical protein